VAQAYISDVTEPKNRARSFGLIGIAFGLGFLVGPAVSGFLYRYGYRVPILAAAGLSFTSIVATTTLLPWRTPARPEAAETPAGEEPRRKLPMRVFVESLSAPVLGPVLWQFFAFIFAFSMFIAGFPLYAERRFVAGGRPFDVQHIGYVLAFSGLIGVIIQGGMIGRLVQVFGERRLILFGFVAMTAAFLGMIPIHTVLPLLLVILALSFGTSVVRPSMTSLVTQIVPRHQQGMAIGLTQSLMAVSQVIAPMVGGALINRGWLGAWAATAGAFCVAGLGLSATRQST
jgi:MFS family permease